MENYTKGDWHIIKDTDKRLHVMSRGKDGTMSINICKMPVHPDAEANAHLIASAPDLYEALKGAVRFIEDFGGHRHLSAFPDNCEHCHIIKGGKQALSKAEGKDVTTNG